jgi:hypothetical protein
MASASRVFGNNWQTQPRTILSTAEMATDWAALVAAQ